MEDVLLCDVDIEVNWSTVTKRKMLSALARIVDPLGMLAPLTLIPKVLLQECWESNLKWDDRVPEPIKRRFKLWAESTKLVSLVKIPQHFGSWNPTKSPFMYFWKQVPLDRQSSFICGMSGSMKHLQSLLQQDPKWIRKSKPRSIS